MKKISSTIRLFAVLGGVALAAGACTPDLLDQKSTTDVSYDLFWKSVDDAEYALYGAYASVRGCFDRDYFFEGMGEFVTGRQNTTLSNTSLINGAAYYSSTWNPENNGSSFDNMFKYLYGGVQRTNYVVENVTKMAKTFPDQTVKPKLDAVVGEAKVLRALCYFRLVTMWGNVPYFTKVYPSSSFAPELTKMPVSQVKDSILKDLTDAISLLPDQRSTVGRMGKAAAYALRGKVNLYYACWTRSEWPWQSQTLMNHPHNTVPGGWPEADLKPDAAASQKAYAAAAADFKEIIDNEGKYGVRLFRDGLPGEAGVMGGTNLGKDAKLPNYFYMFVPTATDGGENGNDSPETILGFTHGGTGSGQSESLTRDFGGRSQGSSQNGIVVGYNIIKRYQLIATGDFAPDMKFPTAATGTAVENARKELGTTVCPDSYAGRDYRMKATLLWNGERTINVSQTGGLLDPVEVYYVFNSYDANMVLTQLTGGEVITQNVRTYRQDTGLTAYANRKFIRNYPGQARDAGDFFWPTIRLADVYLMYAEASNEAYGPMGDGGTAVDVVNKIRARAALPALDASKYGNKKDFFLAIEQERIVELFCEGFRGFDLRRWRKLEETWKDSDGNGGPMTKGVRLKTLHGGDGAMRYQNKSITSFQREYILRYPPSEITRAEAAGNYELKQTPVWN